MQKRKRSDRKHLYFAAYVYRVQFFYDYLETNRLWNSGWQNTKDRHLYPMNFVFCSSLFQMLWSFSHKNIINYMLNILAKDKMYSFSLVNKNIETWFALFSFFKYWSYIK